MVKVLSFRFQQCFSLFIMLLVEGASETGLLRHLSNDVSRIPYLQNYIGYEGHIFLKKTWKLNLDFENAEKSWEKDFFFRDMSIWRSSNKMFLLRREYLSSAVNWLSNNLQIVHITKRDFFQLDCFQSGQVIW